MIPFMKKDTSANEAAVSKTVEQDWPQTADAYNIQVQIGQGAFAKVWKARCEQMNSDVAIKIMELDNLTSSLDDIYQEVRVMLLSKNPSVLRAYACFVVKRNLWLVMPLMRKGSCLRIMKVLKSMGLGEGMKEEWIATILKSTLIGLEYIHQQGKLHRDIKASNLLMDSDGSVRISDFGVAAWLPRGGQDRREAGRRTFVGTPCWMAPEVMEHTQGYDEKADIWSFGITALELAKGYAPYARMQPMKVLLKTIQEPPPSLKSYDDYQATKNKFSRHFREIITLCLQRRPAQRPSASTLLTKKFFKRAPPANSLVKELLESIPIPDCQAANIVLTAAERREQEKALELLQQEQKDEIQRQQKKEESAAIGASATATPALVPDSDPQKNLEQPLASEESRTEPSDAPTIPLNQTSLLDEQPKVTLGDAADALQMLNDAGIIPAADAPEPPAAETAEPSEKLPSKAEVMLAKMESATAGLSFVPGATWDFDDNEEEQVTSATNANAEDSSSAQGEGQAATQEDVSGFEAFAEQYKKMDIKGEDGKTPAE